MRKSPEKYVRLYRKRSDKSRRPFFSQRAKSEKTSFKKLPGWIIDDIKYLTLWILNSLLVIRAYGKTIRENYGLSYYRQFLRMMYLLFVERVPVERFRSHLLYKPRNWRNVNQFTYEHAKAQYHLAEISSNAETERMINKYNFFKDCRDRKIPTPAVLTVFEDGVRTDHEKTVLPLPEKDLFIKDLYGKAGQGIKRLTFTDERYRDPEGNEYTSEEVLQYLRFRSAESTNKGVMIQECVENHRLWRLFTSGSLSTCRLVTAKSPYDDNNTIPLFCALRMPLGDSAGDNFSIGGIISPVDMESGLLGTAVCLKPYHGKLEFDIHPDTGQIIEGTAVPLWKELLDFTLNVHKHFETKFVGWDVAVTTNGCCMIEANIHWSAGSYEIPSQLPLSETIYPELFERWMEKYSEFDKMQ